jgi:hypothetical protein
MHFYAQHHKTGKYEDFFLLLIAFATTLAGNLHNSSQHQHKKENIIPGD